MTDSAASLAFMERLGEYRPSGVHPMTGEPFVECQTFNQDQPYDRKEYGPPSSPSRELYEYSEAVDDMVYVRDLSDEEFAKETAAYKKASAEWVRTQGVIHVVSGPMLTKGTFVTASGAEADGMWDTKAEEWRWVAWRS